MSPYDEWNKIDEDEAEELQDTSIFELKRDVILFCIDCSESMQQLEEDPEYETQTCHLFTALQAAMEIQKRKILVGPSDSVGILLFNTSRNSLSELKKGVHLYQPISQMSAPIIQHLIQLLDTAREDPNELRRSFPPVTENKVPMGDVFTSCNWVFRDGAPKTATKRVFLITNDDTPHTGAHSQQLITSARTTLIDLTQAGITLEPFFISSEEKSFNIAKFYSSILVPSNIIEEDDLNSESSVLPESISISRIEDLLAQMRFHEVPKRALFSIPFHLSDGLTIGIKGYGLVTEQKKGNYRYFVDLGDRMEVAISKTVYVDEETEAEAEKAKLMYGPVTGPGEEGEEDEEAAETTPTRVVKAGQRPFYTAEEIKAFRTLGLSPSLKLLGFKDHSEIQFEDNVKHSLFIYPDESAYSGSKRTFTALLKSMIKKNKIGLVLTMTRSNSTPIFCALLPQEEKKDEDGWTEPGGFHLIPLPFADDIRAAPIDEGYTAYKWVEKLTIKNGAYPPDSYPNPALAFHNEQLQASAFREEYDPDSFEDLTLPKYGQLHKRAGALITAWKDELEAEPSVDVVSLAGSKRKSSLSTDDVEIRSKYEVNALDKLKVAQLKDFLKSKGQPVSGNKAELVQRASEWLHKH
ncbi:hypothetical protein AMATHDRAFT_77665 [Amanita thiersii Skay4041]|uniref:ATP-dependent DNA helicase II subunit 1 n=1 Tax=Amanita thiersii Skay4041 TaxID=703135 RepID=A0A2A9NDZ0_9AGAR|nr:hypothetical protein AMATHDRAFT_77665 [Amanita thiersii Skay4041]